MELICHDEGIFQMVKEIVVSFAKNIICFSENGVYGFMRADMCNKFFWDVYWNSHGLDSLLNVPVSMIKISRFVATFLSANCLFNI